MKLHEDRGRRSGLKISVHAWLGATPGYPSRSGEGLEAGVRVPDWTDAVSGGRRLFVRTFGFQSVVSGNAFEVAWHCT